MPNTEQLSVRRSEELLGSAFGFLDLLGGTLFIQRLGGLFLFLLFLIHSLAHGRTPEGGWIMRVWLHWAAHAV